jgi:threonine dehydrogenase-like Zn-dependent dehydrogenase
VAVARALGAGEILLTARYPHQQELGKAFGATQVLTEEQSTVAALSALGEEKPIDMVVETVGGHANTLTLAGAALAPGGTVTVLGLSFEPVPIDVMPLVQKEATLQWANCYYHQRSGRSDFEEMLCLLQQNQSLWSAMLTHSIPFEEIPRAFQIAADKKSGSVKVTVMMD